MAVEYKAIRLEEGVAERLKKLSKSNGITLSEQLGELLESGGGDLSSLHKRFDDLGVYLEKKFKEVGSSPMAVLDAIDKKNEKPIPKEMEGLQPDELPECCQKAYANMAYGEGVGELCPHWEKAYNNFNQLEYKNTLTGRYMSDRAYDKYV